MTGRGIDQLFAVHNPQDFGKPDHVPARQYLAWSAQHNGAEMLPVRHDYIWGTALGLLDRVRPDFRLVNLETAITTSSAWAPKTFNFRMHPANTACLSAAGLDCCVLANNHTLDFGQDGLMETIAALGAAGIGAAGAGADDTSAALPHVHLLDGDSRILVHSWAGWDAGVAGSWCAGPGKPGVAAVPDYSQATAARMLRQIAEHRRAGDITIASIHWGGNWVQAVPDSHRRLAHLLIDRGGVDVVHGHSTHHPFAAERHKGKLVLYGCGDLVNDYEGKPEYRATPANLGAFYFADVRRETGRLAALRIVPVRRRRFRLERPSPDEHAWVMGQVRSAQTPS